MRFCGHDTASLELSCLLSTIGTNRKNAKESFEKGMGGLACRTHTPSERVSEKGEETHRLNSSMHQFEAM